MTEVNDWDNIGDDDIVECTFRNNLHKEQPLEFNAKPFGRPRVNKVLYPGQRYSLPGWMYKHLCSLGDPIYADRFIPERNEWMSVKVDSDPRFSFAIHNVKRASDVEKNDVKEPPATSETAVAEKTLKRGPGRPAKGTKINGKRES